MSMEVVVWKEVVVVGDTVLKTNFRCWGLTEGTGRGDGVFGERFRGCAGAGVGVSDIHGCWQSSSIACGRNRCLFGLIWRWCLRSTEEVLLASGY